MSTSSLATPTQSLTPWLRLARAVIGAATSAAAFCFLISDAVQGKLSTRAASVLLPALLIALSVCLWRIARTLAIVPRRPVWTFPGFLIGVLLVLLGMPQLGGFSLIDPWETHYAEVAREMIARNDFISPWWAQEGWFMSKPVLSLWLEALAMKAFGAEASSGHVLTASLAGAPHPEWAVRLPGALFMLVGCQLLYAGVAAASGPRAGFLAALALATSAQWALVSRHALTDAPFVGALTAAFGLMLWAGSTPHEQRLARHSIAFGRRSVSFDASWLLVAAVSSAVLPQVGLLLFRQVELQRAAPHSLRFVADVLTAGSAGNCGLPSQPACVQLAVAERWLSPGLQGSAWILCLAPLLYSLGRVARLRPLLLLGAWYFASLASMGKGVAGLALPLSVAAAYGLSRGRFRSLPHIEVLRGGALLVLLVAPWYLAMYARHGRVIFDELVLRHMLSRALEHLHDTNASVDVSFRYYVWQLGYALFPWVGFLPSALLAASTPRPARPAAAQCLQDFALIWLVSTFALFTVMRTKFHHYILPALPPACVLIGVHLAELWHPRVSDSGAGLRSRYRATVARVLALGGALLVLAIGVDWVTTSQSGVPGSARLFHLFSYQYERSWPEPLDFTLPLGIFAAACAIVCASIGWRRARRMLIGLQALLALAFAGWAGQHYLVRLAPHFGQRHSIEAFYRDRTSPEEPLIAYQLNWKGENFYTGNRLAIFVKSGAPLREYITARRASGQQLFHFVLEPSRLPALRRELEQARDVTMISDAQTSDKFCLVRAELPALSAQP